MVFIQDLREIQRLQLEKEQAERMAAVGMTVAGLAHYIKNIVTGLKGGAYVIRSALAKENLDLIGQGWGMVERNIDQIAGIVTDMLVYSRKGEPSYDMVDPGALVRDVVELMTDKARLSGVSLRYASAPGMTPVSMDRTAIHRCLLDLLSNAIDACALEGILKDKGVVSIEADQTADGGVKFRVSDNGTGMDEATQKRLFSDFFTTKGYKGTGLGLPVTYKIVRDHGGSLTFTSRPGRGTVFDLTLPGKNRENHNRMDVEGLPESPEARPLLPYSDIRYPLFPPPYPVRASSSAIMSLSVFSTSRRRRSSPFLLRRSGICQGSR